MELDQALSFAVARQRAVLTTIRRDGRPQLSNIMYVHVDGEFWISVTESRAKTKNLRRDSRAGLYVPGDDFWSYVVLDGTVVLTDVARQPDDAVTEQLVDYYRRVVPESILTGSDFRATMVREGRLLAKFTATSSYGMMN
jgi:PPOX class probable F420-dependent enzyme